jgi:hypothetical protein
MFINCQILYYARWLPTWQFCSTRGLRQGDPLSPFLFILGAEALSRLILSEERKGNLHGIQISRHSPSVSHLAYADDFFFFSKAKATEADTFLQCLKKYEAWSGQMVNFTKSSIFFSKNTKDSSILSIKSILNLKQIPPLTKYLGLPLFFHRNKAAAFEDIKQKILNRISGWKAKLLSQAAKTILIKTVANSIPTYSMSLFKFPTNLCKDLDTAARKFWWGFPANKTHNLSLLSWKKICSPKSFGGLGFRLMGEHNSALLAKLGWKILNKENLLWVHATRGKYLRNLDLLETPNNPTASWIWKGILSNLDIVSAGACRTISSDSMLNVWESPWVPSLPQFKPVPNINSPINHSLRICDLIDPINRSWIPDLLFQAFDPQLQRIS